MMGVTARAQAVVKYGEPMQIVETKIPPLSGTQVLIKNTYAGMCHSDVHLWQGAIGGFKMSRKPPFVLGHEMEGRVVAVGPDVKDKSIVGKTFAIYPWVGCETSECPYCNPASIGDQAHHCVSPKSLRITDGMSMFGGYSSHTIVSSPKYLVDYTGALPEGLASVYMCSGLTAYSAVKKVGIPPYGAKDVLIVGLGGLGFQAVGFATAMLGGSVIVLCRAPMAADIRPESLQAAAAIGVTTFNSKHPDVVTQIKEASHGGVYAVIDFVGSAATHALARQVLRRGGRCIVVGLFGGSIPKPLTNISLFALTETMVCGSFTGSFTEVNEMMDVLRRTPVDPPPHTFVSITEANHAIQELEKGNITGMTPVQMFSDNNFHSMLGAI